MMIPLSQESIREWCARAATAPTTNERIYAAAYLGSLVLELQAELKDLTKRDNQQTVIQLRRQANGNQ